MELPWHALRAEDALRELGADRRRGLTDDEARARLARHGPNAFAHKGGRGVWPILSEQFKSAMVGVLVAAAVVSLFLGDKADAVAIAAILAINVCLGFFQEYRADRSMDALKKLVVQRCRVRRNGKFQEIEPSALVPGDVIALEAGARVPADARVLEAAALRAEESSLTGESEPVEKSAEPVEDRDAALGDRVGMVYLGTKIAAGRGLAVVVETGMRTELGRIAESVRSAEEGPTPLQRRLERVGRQLAGIALAIVIVFFVLGLLRGEPAKLMFVTAISMAVAAVPEGLPAVVTATLAIAARRMLKRKALVRKLTAVEALGSVTVICSDKTGTLTENRMTLKDVDAASEAAALAAAALCGDAYLAPGDGPPRAEGDPTETALVVAAAERGLRRDALEKLLPRRAEAPFDSGRKRMSTVHDVGDGLPPELAAPFGGASRVLLVKGAAEGVLSACARVWDGSAAVPLGAERREELRRAEEALAARGMRVLGAACRAVEGPLPRDVAGLERDLTFLGFFGLADPPRAEVRGWAEACRRAGIRLVMITGDHPATAKSIGQAVGLKGEALTGRDLLELPSAALAERARSAAIFARVSPDHKLRIVEALQARGEIVAMTGDGVNDGPALKQADIGVAMGGAGTDVAKEAAEMVLLDDRFSTIVVAIREGRVVYDNIRKFLTFLMATNVAELLLMILAPVLGAPLPLTPVQILWINLLTDGVPALALAFEPAEADVMDRPPRSADEPLFSRRITLHIAWAGALMAGLALGAGELVGRADETAWRTTILMTIVATQLAHSLAIRTDLPVFSRGRPPQNLHLWAAVALTSALQSGVLWLEPMRRVFGTSGLSPLGLALPLVGAAAVFAAVELEKFLYVARRGGRNVA